MNFWREREREERREKYSPEEMEGAGGKIRQRSGRMDA